MTHEGCCTFYQLRNYKSVQQGFSGMRTFLGHRIASDPKHHLVSLNKSIVFFISVLTVTNWTQRLSLNKTNRSSCVLYLSTLETKNEKKML